MPAPAPAADDFTELLTSPADVKAEAAPNIKSDDDQVRVEEPKPDAEEAKVEEVSIAQTNVDPIDTAQASVESVVQPAAEPVAQAAVEPVDPLASTEVRTWRDNTGNFEVTGRLVVVFPDKIRLLKDNGRFSTVPLRRLSQEDRQYVEQTLAAIADRSGKFITVE